MTATDEEAATKVQALQRGKSARRGDAQALAAIEASDLDVLQKLVASGARFSATSLVAALDSPVRALASLLVSQQSAWNVPEHDLAIWNLVQAAISPPPVEDEDDEEPEEVDVEDEEWQEEIAAKVFGAEGDANYDADAIYHVRRVVSVGCYAGGRAQMAQTHEPAFDDELTEREGYGVHLGPKGGVYAGYWQDGRRHGVGVYLYPDKSVYCGEWKEGMKHGSGRMAYADGGVYEGSWKYNKRHGHGVFTYPNGDLHVGKWFTGAKHGEGKYTNKQSGCRYIGVWREGALSQATVKTPDGRTMLSGFEAGEPEGAGAFVMPSGVVARGAHSHAPKADDEDADEEEPKTVLRWEGESLSHADRTTTPKLAAMHAGAAGAAPGQRKAMLIAPDYGGSGGGAFPPLDVSPSAHKLKEVLVGKLAFADVDVDVVTGERSSKEAVTEALTELAGRLGRGDVAFVALLGHGKKLLDLDNEDLEPDEMEEGICLSDEVLSNDDLSELIAMFTKASVHLFLWIDSCFEGECLKELLPPNVCAINATLQLDAKPQGEGSTRWQSYFAANMTQFLCSALEAAPSASYEELHAAVLDSQQAADMRSAVKQLPVLYTKDRQGPILQPM